MLIKKIKKTNLSVLKKFYLQPTTNIRISYATTLETFLIKNKYVILTSLNIFLEVKFDKILGNL
jgi:hypothetical protein